MERHRVRTPWRRVMALGAIVAVGIVPATTAFASGSGGRPPKGTTVLWRAGGLSNPRGVSVALDGSVYVAESGSAGPTLAEAQIEGEPSPICIGDTGAVTRIKRGETTPIATFPSFGEAGATAEGAPTCDPAATAPDKPIGFATTGPSDVAWRLNGSVQVTVGLGGNGAVRDQIPTPFRDSFGKLFSISRRGDVSEVADISGFEDANNPTGDQVDSNPYGVTTSLFGTTYVADAGGNDIVAVDRRGNVSALATFPQGDPVPTPALSCIDNETAGLPPAGSPLPADFVPTSVVVGPDGFVYVSQLTGFPFAPETAKVYRINPWTGATSVVAEGFTNVVGIAFGPDLSMYVVEIAREGLLEGEICGNFAGRLWKVRHGQKTEIVVPDGGLNAPGGVAVGLDGTIYVTNNSVVPNGGGELIAIRNR